MKASRKLNYNQYTTLLLTHKFRFVTSALLSKDKQVNQSASARTLETLRKNGYLNRHYDKTCKLQGKAARYYLSKQGRKYLVENSDINPLTLNLHYKNKNMGMSYIDHHIAVYELYLKFSEQYKYYDIFSKIELSRDEEFVDPKPDLYLEPEDESKQSIIVSCLVQVRQRGLLRSV